MQIFSLLKPIFWEREKNILNSWSAEYANFADYRLMCLKLIDLSDMQWEKHT